MSDGTSDALTVSSATPVFEGLLSAEPEYQETPETQPTQESPESGSDTDEVKASTEPAESEETKSEENEETPETPEEPSATLDPNLKVKVKVNGEDREITLAEALKGYSRTEDYTRKTQEVAEQRRAAEAHNEAVRVERETYANKLTQLDQALEEAAPVEPDWVTVQRDHPDEFPGLWARWSQYKDRREAIRKERDEAQQVVLRDREAAAEKHVQAEQAKLIEAIPTWKDATKAKAEKAKLVEFAESMGYTREELSQVRDHRAIKLLHAAWKMQELEKKKPVIDQRIATVRAATPGSGGSAPVKSAKDKAFAALAKSGKPEDSVAAFATILED